jgi:hypothetical protein
MLSLKYYIPNRTELTTVADRTLGKRLDPGIQGVGLGNSVCMRGGGGGTKPRLAHPTSPKGQQ